MYLYLLQRYLFQKYRSESESMEKCSKILSSIEDASVVVKTHFDAKEEYEEYLTPLLREVMIR